MKEIYKEYPYDKRYKVSNKGNVIGVKGYVLKQYVDSKGYPMVNIGKKSIRTHLPVAETWLNHVRCGHKIVVDHIDNNPQNNNLDNLQLVEHRINCSKDKKDKTSKHTGVSLTKSGKYRTNVCLGGKVYSLGSYNTEIESYHAYLDALNEYNKFLAE